MTGSDRKDASSARRVLVLASLAAKKQVGPASLPAVLAVLTLFSSAALADDVPPRTPGWQTLEVPKAQLDLGEVYYVVPGEDTQFICTSDALVQRAAATCSRIVGYVVAPFDLETDEAPLLAGAFRIPAAALKTGLEPSDEALRSKLMLNAAEYPEITFRLLRVTDAKPAGEEGVRKSYTLNLVGELRVKDKTIELTVPARLTFVPFTWQTMYRTLGDSLILRATFEVKLADIGVEKPDKTYTGRIADTVKVDLFLLCNTLFPETPLVPKVKREHHVKQLRFVTLLRDFNDPEKGYEFGRAFLREIWDDAPALDRLATATLTEAGIVTRDLSFALKAAQRANELTEFKDPALLGTLARVYDMKADSPTALKWARQAVERLEGAPPEVAAEVRAALQRYETQAERNKE